MDAKYLCPMNRAPHLRGKRMMCCNCGHVDLFENGVTYSLYHNNGEGLEYAHRWYCSTHCLLYEVTGVTV